MRRILTVLLILLLLGGSVFAASKGSIGVVGFTNWANLTSGEIDEEAFLGGIRAELFLGDLLGISGDAMFTGKDDGGANHFILFADAIVRLPLGLLDPYVGLGLNYTAALTDDLEESAAQGAGFNVRAGLDVNILKNFSVGLDATYYVDDFEKFFNNISEFDPDEFLQSSLIGISIKYKF
ncbi:MAG: outer membrane beta-barrel protein [Sphaerochaetaceae bacterium]|jgi:opacity protein-like surface antigen